MNVRIVRELDRKAGYVLDARIRHALKTSGAIRGVNFSKEELEKGWVTNFSNLQPGNHFRVFTEDGESKKVYLKLQSLAFLGPNKKAGQANSICINNGAFANFSADEPVCLEKLISLPEKLEIR